MRVFTILGPSQSGKTTLARARLGKLGEGLADVVAVGCMADQAKHLDKAVLLRALDAGLGDGNPVGGGTLAALGGLDTGADERQGDHGNTIGSTGLSHTAPPHTGASRSGLQAGDIGQAIKCDDPNLGYCYSADGSAGLPGWAQPPPSTYRRLVVPVHQGDEALLSAALDRMVGIDPAVKLEQDPISGRALLHLQGPLHLRRVLATLETEFRVEAIGEQVPPAFCETLREPIELRYRHRKQSGGAGQFADVLIEMRPLSRGSGFQFHDRLKGGAVPKACIPSVEAGVREALREGNNSHPVVDVAVILKVSKHHAVDSADFAFRTAARNAVRSALDQADLVLLQPIMKVAIHVPSVFSGRVIPVISNRKGQVLGFAAEDGKAGWVVLEALIPLVAQDGLCHGLASASRGTGWFETAFDHYEEVRQDDLAPV
jgi:elongation factor G